MENTKFYICPHCTNIVGMVNDTGVTPVCCSEKMKALTPNTVEASTEKHLPVCKIEGDKLTVEVGSVPHPMTEAHHIAWVYVLLENGGRRVILSAESEPKAVITLDTKPIAVYAYCNLHGLWMTEIK